MNVTVPQQQQGPALSCWAQRSISLPIATDPSLRGGVTLCDCSNGQGLFFTIEPCLTISFGTSATSAFSLIESKTEFGNYQQPENSDC